MRQAALAHRGWQSWRAVESGAFVLFKDVLLFARACIKIVRFFSRDSREIETLTVGVADTTNTSPRLSAHWLPAALYRKRALRRPSRGRRVWGVTKETLGECDRGSTEKFALQPGSRGRRHGVAHCRQVGSAIPEAGSPHELFAKHVRPSAVCPGVFSLA